MHKANNPREAFPFEWGFEHFWKSQRTQLAEQLAGDAMLTTAVVRPKLVEPCAIMQ